MSKDRAKFRRGFSLLEMTVVLTIVAIMTAISLWNMPKLKGGLSIDIVAQELAIYVRGAQVYSRATKIARDQADFSEGGGGSAMDDIKRYHSFGMHFEKDQESFFLWADNDDSSQDGSDYLFSETGDSVEETYNLPRGYSVSNIFSDGLCSGSPDPVSFTEADIVFRRPDPEAYFACNPSSHNIGCSDVCGKGSSIWIEITSANDKLQRYVRVSNNGQIVVQKTK